MNLCLSAFVRVATSASFSPSSPSPFASAHSCGLRLYPFMRRSIVVGLCLSAFVRVATLRRSFHRLNSNFASAHSCGLRQQPQFHVGRIIGFASAHSCGLRLEFNPLNDVDYTLCLSAFVRVATRRMNQQASVLTLCLSAFVRVATAEKQCSALRICCEKVDSFSSVGESGLALTIFPFSFAAKATYVAINDSFGRAIDRFFWCEPHRN